MREGLLVAILGILGIGGAVLYFGPTPVRDLIGSSKVVVRDTSPQRATESKEKHTEKKREGVVSQLPNPVERVEPISGHTPDAAPEVVWPKTVASNAPRAIVFPFPEAGEVKIGSPKSQILNDFGLPILSASTNNGGHAFEAYVYKQRGKHVIIHLRDARVSDVYTRN